MVYEYRANVWIVRAGYCGQQERECFEKGVLSLDLNLHLLEQFGQEFMELRDTPVDHKKHFYLGEQYREFDDRFRKEFEDATKGVDISSESERPEVVRKMHNLNRKLKSFNQELRQFDETMHKFDNFERREQIKEMIVTKLAELDESVLDVWSEDVFNFTIGMKLNDIVILPLESEGLAGVGKVRENYRFRKGFGYLSHYRRMWWADDKVPLSGFCSEFAGLMASKHSVIPVEGSCRETIMDIVSRSTF
ncbi:hypothetical protein PV02_11080 [Methanolobus chelungpuianus]|uniref:Uncharacterized protein n=2 Tax=Methanolobus chelungpuianus TaxID=502115 RepID=A0AAE3KYE1_9EURY|nr:hypothetical protein [Methanolobus chelungpuianus]